MISSKVRCVPIFIATDKSWGAPYHKVVIFIVCNTLGNTINMKFRPRKVGLCSKARQSGWVGGVSKLKKVVESESWIWTFQRKVRVWRFGSNKNYKRVRIRKFGSKKILKCSCLGFLFFLSTKVRFEVRFFPKKVIRVRF